MNKLIAFFISVMFAASHAATPTQVGIILLHGKGGSPNFHFLEKFTSKMSQKGYEVVAPSFPWSGQKGKADYSGKLVDAFKVLDDEIAKLKQAGRTKIVLAGHSMGTPAAVAYVAEHASVDGVIGIAPGHLVGSSFHDKFVFFDVRKARQAVESGAGDDLLHIEDYNSGGRRFQMDVKAKDYLSFFDPEGPFNFASNLRKLGGVPFLWVAPNTDPVTQSGLAAEFFSQAPQNAKSKLVEIEAKHINAPVKGVEVIDQWISEL